jgi:hypothetical protein
MNCLTAGALHAFIVFGVPGAAGECGMLQDMSKQLTRLLWVHLALAVNLNTLNLPSDALSGTLGGPARGL